MAPRNLFKLETFLAFLVGISLGRMGPFYKFHKVQIGPKKGKVLVTDDVPVRNTVHVDEQGLAITKQQFIEPFDIPNLAGFSVATFLPGQTMLPPHHHESMHEIFYILAGTGVFQIEDVDHEICPGSYLQIAPKERHGIWVPKSSDEPLKMIVIGITVGEG